VLVHDAPVHLEAALVFPVELRRGGIGIGREYLLRKEGGSGGGSERGAKESAAVVHFKIQRLAGAGADFSPTLFTEITR
jgi:hypothetical protein